MDNYKVLIEFVHQVLKPLGFTKSGTTFHLFKDNNWGMINFQKSKSSTAGIIKFTINISICSARLREKFDHGDLSKKPAYFSSHWLCRIGNLLPKGDDHWWELTDTTPMGAMTAEIVDVIATLAVPQIQQHIADENLIQEWLNGKSSGITEFSRYIYLTTLLKCYNRRELQGVIDEFIDRFKGKPIEHSMHIHLDELKTF